MTLYKRDTYSEFRDNSYRYYVHTLPVERKLTNPSRQEWEPDREQLERKYFAKLQDQRGFGSIIVTLIRCLVWIVLFPFYIVKYTAKLAISKIRQVANAVKQVLLPSYLKVVLIYRRMKVAYAQVKIALHLRKALLREKVKSRLHRFFIRPFIPLKTWYSNKKSPTKSWLTQVGQRLRMEWSCLTIWLGVLAKYSMRVVEDWKTEVKQKFPTK